MTEETTPCWDCIKCDTKTRAEELQYLDPRMPIYIIGAIATLVIGALVTRFFIL